MLICRYSTNVHLVLVIDYFNVPMNIHINIDINALRNFVMNVHINVDINVPIHVDMNIHINVLINVDINMLI